MNRNKHNYDCHHAKRQFSPKLYRQGRLFGERLALLFDAGVRHLKIRERSAKHCGLAILAARTTARAGE
jgi:hypothetical protein